MSYRDSKSFFYKRAARYKIVKSGSFTPERWCEISELETEAYNILHRYESDELYVSRKNLKAFIRYVMAFTEGQPEQGKRFFEKMQKQADFDVNAYVKNLRMSWDEKLLKFFGVEDCDYLSSAQMKSRYKAYRNICRRFDNGIITSYSKAQKVEELREKALQYAKLVDEGEIEVLPEDYFEFRNYMSIVCYPLFEGTHEYNAFQKVSKLLKERQEPVKEMKNKQSLVRKFGNFIKKSCVAASNRVKKLKENLNSFWKSHGNKIKGGVVSLAFLGAVFGIAKNCEGNSKDSSNVSPVVEHIQIPDSTVKKDTLALSNVFDFKKTDDIKQIQPFSFVKADWGKMEAKQLVVEQKVDSVALHEQKIWNNYYDNTIEMLSSAEKKQELYAQIEAQIQKGIFSLNDSISKEKVAYAYLIYKAYAVPSSIESVLNSSEKLSEEAQSKFIEDIVNTGKKGEGVQKMAAKKRGGNLSSYSRYNKSSKQLQKKHIENLKQLRNLKKSR